jgi:hypothetical protein
MQKFVTIYLDSQVYMGGQWLKVTHADRHGCVEEHLQQYLQEGWRVTSVYGIGGADGGVNARGWFAVVLEK